MNLNKTNETNLRDLKETLGLIEKYSKRFYRYANILNKGFIDKQEVINLKSIFGGYKRNNLTDNEMSDLLNKFLYPITDNVDYTKQQLLISKDHTIQGLKFLEGLYLTPTGKRKKISHLGDLNGPDGYTVDSNIVEHVLSFFSHFQFNGFLEEYNQYGNRAHYIPVWLTVAKDGQSFEYVQTFSGFWRR